MIKAVFFDLYGTLAGFEPSRYDIQSTACSNFGINVTPSGILKGYAAADSYMAAENTDNPLRKRDQIDRDAFFAEYERQVLAGCGVEVDIREAFAIWQHVLRIPYSMTRFDDVQFVMDQLKIQGFILGIISNMNTAGSDLAQSLGLGSYLDFSVTSAEVGMEKPHPPIFLTALELAGVAPYEAVHVGDQLRSDVEGARGVGITPVLIDRDGNHRDFEACPRIDSLSELIDLLAELCKPV